MKECNRLYRYCGRDFSGEELQKIRQLIASDDQPNRVTISRRVCDVFGWFKLDGGLKEMSCRVALLRMERDHLIQLPLPQKGNGNRTKVPSDVSPAECQNNVLSIFRKAFVG